MRISSFASGSSGNCLLLQSGGSSLLIDAGISARRIGESLALCGLGIDDLDAVLITHEHSDHICGLASLVKSHAVPVLAPPTVAGGLRRRVAGIEKNLRVIKVGEDTPVGCLSVRAFHTPHDTQECVGYRVSGERVFALATDMGKVTDEVIGGLLGADAALIESNHDPDMLKDGPYPYPLKARILSDRGHLSNPDCAGLAGLLAENGTRYIILGHLSKENNRPSLALDTVRPKVDGTGAQIYVAGPDSRLTLEL